MNHASDYTNPLCLFTLNFVFLHISCCTTAHASNLLSSINHNQNQNHYPRPTGECPRRSMKRRSHTNTRRVSKESAINMAEARREIVHALRLHRSASSSASPRKRGNAILGNNNANKPNSIVGSQFYCYSLINTLPTPEPIWSTTAPSILAAPAAAPAEELEFEWAENEPSSWSWWLGFLKALDKNSDRSSVEEEPPNGGNVVFMEKSGEKNFVEQSDDQGSFPDEWLVIPTNYDEDEAAVP